MSDPLTTMAYERARSVPEALTLLADGGEDTRPIAGGQSLVPMMNLGLAAPTFLVDVSSIPSLLRVTVDGPYLVIGACVTHHALTTHPLVGEHAPLLAKAATRIGSQRIRNRGTIGGSIAHADAAAELPVSAHALAADYLIERPSGREWRAAAQFSLGHYQTDLRPGELITAIRVPASPQSGSGFQEYSRRAGDFALASVAAVIDLDQDRIARASVAVAGAAGRPLRLDSLEHRLVGSRQDAVEGIVAGLQQDLDPDDDPYTAGRTKARLIEVLTIRAVLEAFSDARKNTR